AGLPRPRGGWGHRQRCAQPPERQHALWRREAERSRPRGGALRHGGADPGAGARHPAPLRKVMATYRCTSCGEVNRGRTGPGTPVCGRCKNPLPTDGAPQDVNADGLERAVASSPVPVLVDFWAPWCAPCRVAAPLFDEVARRLKGDAIVLKVDTEANPEA